MDNKENNTNISNIFFNKDANSINIAETLFQQKEENLDENIDENIDENTDENIEKINERNNKDFFSNIPLIYFLVKIILLFEAQIIRFLIQIGDFYFSCIITNMYLEIILIQVCASAISNVFIKIYAFISALIFAFLMKSTVTIAYWELYQLKWFDLNPFNSITNLLNLELKVYQIRNVSYIVNIILGIIFWLLIIGILTMSNNNCKFLDSINLMIFIIIPIIKYLILYFSYIFICFRNLIYSQNREENEKNPFQYWLKLNNLIDQGVIKIGGASPENNSEDNKVSFCTKLFCKEILFEVKTCTDKILKISLKTLFRIFLAILSFIYCLYLLFNRGATAESIFFLIFVYYFSLIISIHFSTPLWIINAIYRWHLKRKKRYDEKLHEKCRIFNEKFGTFKIIDSLPLILSLVFLLFLCISAIVFDIREPIFKTAEKRINKVNKFKVTDWKREYFSEIKNIENAICFTNIYGLSLLKISSLAFASYMNDPENIIDYYEKSFFKEKIENITEMRYLDRNSQFAVVLMTNIDIPNEKPLTVFSIQASIKKLDFWVDLEIFCSAAFFSITRILSMDKLESITSRAITWLLSIPIKTLEKFTLFSKYIDSLNVEEEIKKISGTRNIIFTGHSLGGGLAKYLGLKYHKQNVAFSGPGITPLEYKFTEEENYYKYFKSNLIDIVPDNDLIPKVETSRGILYRVLCEKSFLHCHYMSRTLCQIGATCRREDLSGDICMSIFGKNKYEEMRELARIKSKMPDDYN